MTVQPAGGADPSSVGRLRALLRQYGFRPRRSLGQIFLVDANIVRKIVSAADLSADDSVLEIGPGAGGVTRHLAAAAGRVVAIEIDPVLVEVLRETVGEAAEVICGDVLAVDLGAAMGGQPDRPWKVVANLPYSITGPALVRLLEARRWISEMVVMVQAEVAERLLAAPGSRERGWLTAFAEICCEMRSVGSVSRNCFWPRPKVDSAILGMRVRRPALMAPEREALVQEVIKAAFSTRRKTVVNALSQAARVGLTKDRVRSLLEQCGILPELRAEALSAEDFLRLAEAVEAATEEPT